RARCSEPALRHEARYRRIAPAVGATGGGRRNGPKARRAGLGRGGRGGGGGCERAGGPRPARGGGARGQRRPRRAPRRPPGAPEPGLLPEVLAPFDLAGRELALVGIDVDLVGEYANAQLLGAVGL